jgi:hypothetical protein
MQQGKPNILVIWGDDIGITNLSCYSDGLMGYRTPNIDRIANEGNVLHGCLRVGDRLRDDDAPHDHTGEDVGEQPGTAVASEPARSARHRAGA